MVITICLPRPALERAVERLNRVVGDADANAMNEGDEPIERELHYLAQEIGDALQEGEKGRMEVIVVRDPETGEPLFAVRNVGPEADWGTVDDRMDGHLFSGAVPLYETPTELVADLARWIGRPWPPLPKK